MPPDAVAPAVVFRGVTKRHGASVSVAGVDLALPAGRTTVLLGPSGSGKSTVLRLINGLLTPDEGEVTVLGTAVGRATVTGLRRRTGYVIQEGGLFPHLDVLGNVALLARCLGWPEARIAARAREVSALVKLPETLFRRKPSALSGGERQRVTWMRALMLDPELLLLDEPLGALDPLVRAELQDDLRAVFRALGKSVVLVTHDLAEAAHFADEVVLMRGGRVVQHGPFATLQRAPADAFVERFLAAQRSLWAAAGGGA